MPIVKMIHSRAYDVALHCEIEQGGAFPDIDRRRYPSYRTDEYCPRHEQAKSPS